MVVAPEQELVLDGGKGTVLPGAEPGPAALEGGDCRGDGGGDKS